jgi:hypothetical protein
MSRLSSTRARSQTSDAASTAAPRGGIALEQAMAKKKDRAFFICPRWKDLLLVRSKEARRRDRADERLFGRFRADTRCSGDGGQLARDLRRLLTLHHRADAGRRCEAP